MKLTFKNRWQAPFVTLFLASAALGITAPAYAHHCEPGECIAQSIKDLHTSEKPVIEVRVMVGYDDCSPDDYVCNVDNTAYLRDLLESNGYEKAEPTGMGIIVAPDPTNLFAYTHPTEPDENGNTKTVHITFASAALSGSAAQNTANASEQNIWSANVFNIYWKDSLQNADAVFYLGHSRDGGGPDPYMPILNHEKHVDYDAYQDKKPGITGTVNFIKADDMGPRIIGLFSCSSKSHFASYLKKAYSGKPGKESFIGSTKLISNDEMLEGFFDALWAIQTSEVDPMLTNEKVFTVVGIDNQ